MTLEATIIAMDNSEHMRNGDYTPTRIDAQQDAVKFLFRTKTGANRESSVGLMTMAATPDVLMTLSAENQNMHRYLKAVKLTGALHLSQSLLKAQLALKYRQNKRQRMRIIAFVASPICGDDEDAKDVEKALVKIAKKLKKSNVNVDIVNFGETAQNTEILEAFMQAVNKDSASHLVTIPPGPHLLSDILASSAIVRGEDAGDSGAGAGAGGDSGMGGIGEDGFYGGVDPSVDPELALALRVSYEEERQRRERAQAEEAAKAGGSDGASGSVKEEATGGAAQASTETAAADAADNDIPMDEDDLVNAAIAMSREDAEGDGDVDMTDMTEDEAVAYALQLSMQDEENEGNSDEGEDEAGGEGEDDMAAVLGSLPGVDANDPALKDTLDKLNKDDE